MARHLGIVDLGAEIRKIQPRDFSEKEWIGSFRYTTLQIPKPLPAPGKVIELQEASKHHLTLVAVAGAVAEACWGGETSDDLYDTWESDPLIMSTSDWENAGCAPGEPSQQFLDAVEEASRLLKRREGELWKYLVRDSRNLIEECR
jgi:hypothetical protein